jgi:prophage regulatory protein
MTDQPDRILRLKTVLERTGLSRSTLYRKIANGSFPRQIPISARCAGWRESSVQRWIVSPMFYEVDENGQ